MSRTAKYKALYFVYAGGAAVIAACVLALCRFSEVSIVAVTLAAFIPGRILGFFWRDLLRGLRLLNHRKYAESKGHSELFLATLARRPWIRHLIWLGTSSYSRNPEALALNNLGGAELGLGNFDAARRHFESAIAVDEQCPMPYFNMGVLCRKMGQHEEAQRWFEQAVARGYTRSALDRFMVGRQTRYANSDGGGNF